MFPRTPRFLAAVLLVLLLPLLPLGASSFTEELHWAMHGSLFIFAASNGRQGADPAPILPSLGGSIAWPFWGPLRLELTEDIYFRNYEYNSELGIPMASNPENRSAFVMGFLTGIQLVGIFPIGEKGITVRAYGGPVMDIRIVTLAFGLSNPADFTGEIESDPRLQTNAIRSYFWGSGRWLLPVLGAGMDFPINEKFLLGFDFRMWIPLYRLWTNENSPAINGWRFGLGFRITPRKTSE